MRPQDCDEIIGPIEEEKSPKWHWRNCRSLGVSIHLYLWPWVVGFHKYEDLYGGQRYLNMGPFSVGMVYSIGNFSAEGFERHFALSDTEAWERAVKWEEGESDD